MPLIALIYPSRAGYAEYEIVESLTGRLRFKSSGPSHLVRELAETKRKQLEAGQPKEIEQ